VPFTGPYSNTLKKEELVRILLWNTAEFEVPSVASVTTVRYCSAEKVTWTRSGTDFSEIILKIFL
jgi:hypothetical protein